MTSRAGQMRESGRTAAEEETARASAELIRDIKVELPEEKPKATQKDLRTPGFSRMRMVWNSADKRIIESAKAAVEGALVRNFEDAYLVMNQIYELIRAPETDSVTGQPLRNNFGFVIWKRTPSGSFEEDWTRLTVRSKESLLFTITTRLFDWKQRAADVWGEAMFAKAQWEERYSIAYDAPMSGTIEDRTAHANVDAREERYFAIFTTLYSRKADALVGVMELLGQRIKDSMLT